MPFFPLNPTKNLHHLLYSDVWGPSKITTMAGKRWFITFIDNHTRFTWVFLLQEKSDIALAFKKIYQMVLTQFRTQIRILCRDNGKEFFNKISGNFFTTRDIVHQCSCTNTPQQNEIVERKNKQLLEVAWALSFQTKVPKCLWGDAISTATYLINRLPTRILEFKTPSKIFTTCFPATRQQTFP